MLCYDGDLWELALLIHQCHNVHRPHSYQVQRLLVVNKLNVCPVDGLVIVFFLQE
jgi:hypothetical protein